MDLDRRGHDPHLHAVEIVERGDRLLAVVDVAHAGGEGGEALDAELLRRDDLVDHRVELGVVQHPTEVVDIIEHVADAEETELGDEGRGVGGGRNRHVEIAGDDAVEHRHLVAELGAGEDGHGPVVAELLLEALVEIDADLLVAVRLRLVVPEPQRLGRGGRGECQRGAGQRRTHDPRVKAHCRLSSRLSYVRMADHLLTWRSACHRVARKESRFVRPQTRPPLT
ncbi:MAG: hypothetical protein R3D28_20345 [Geminicoccaceae bacterium]